METDVVQNPGVHESEREVRHTGQLTHRVHIPDDVAGDLSSALVDDAVDLLRDVHVELVVDVLHSGAAPGHVRDLGGRQVRSNGVLAGNVVDDVSDYVGGLDELLQEVGLRGLREPVVHHLVQDLVDEHYLLSDLLFRALVQVLREYVSHPVEELDHEERGALPAQYGHEVDIVLEDVYQVEGPAGYHGGKVVRRRGLSLSFIEHV